MENHPDSSQLCFSLMIPFWEAPPFSEILSRRDTFFAGFYLSISLIYFPFLFSGGRECPFQVLVAFSVNCGFMLFVQHLAERGLCSHPGLCSHGRAEGITLLWECHCAWSWGRLLAPCVCTSLAFSQRWWSGPDLQLFIAKGEKEMIREVSSSLWGLGEVGAGCRKAPRVGAGFVGGGSSHTDISHPV